MQTFVLSEHTATAPIGPVLQQAEAGAVEVRDAAGNVVGFMVSPRDREALTYFEAYLDFEQHRDQIREALRRGGGITTQELLRRAHAASAKEP